VHGNCYSAVLCVRAVRSSAVPWSEHCEVGHRIHTRYKATHPAWSRRSGVEASPHVCAVESAARRALTARRKRPRQRNKRRPAAASRLPRHAHGRR